MFCLSYNSAKYIIVHLYIYISTENSFERCKNVVAQLNDQFKFLLRTNQDPEYQTENAYEVIVNEKPYRIMATSAMLFKVYAFFN